MEWNVFQDEEDHISIQPILQRRTSFCLMPFFFHLIRQTVINETSQLPRMLRRRKKTTLNSTNRLNHILTLHQNDDIVLFCRFFFGSSWNLKHQSHSSHSGSFVVCTCFFLRMFPLFPLFAQCNSIQHFIYFFPMCIRFF